jgi:ABC-type multidrug transport system fused ATPase/permease subunit
MTIDILSLFQAFLTIFVSTLTNVEIIWITYPVYIVWFSMELLIERERFTYGHSLANSIIFSWVSVDWLRHLYLHHEFDDHNKLILTTFFLSLSIFTLLTSIKRKKIAKILGRTGSFAYFQIMFTPFIYGIIEFNYINFLAVIIFYPLVYFVIYVIDKLVPKFAEEEEKFEGKINEEYINNFAESNLQYNQQNYNNYYDYYGYNYGNYYRNYYYRYRR